MLKCFFVLLLSSALSLDVCYAESKFLGENAGESEDNLRRSKFQSRTLKNKKVYMFADTIGISSILLKNNSLDDDYASSAKGLSIDVKYNKVSFYPMEDMERGFQDPNAPHFVMSDKRNRIAFGIGGYVKTIMSYDFGGSSYNRLFAPFDFKVPNNKYYDKQFVFDACPSTLFFKMTGYNEKIGRYFAYIEGDFSNDMSLFSLKHACVYLCGFLIGKYHSTFSDPKAGVPTVDDTGPCGNTGVQQVQLRYSKYISRRWKIAAAVEMSGGEPVIVNEYMREVRQFCPDFPFFIQYEWGSNSHLRATGLLKGVTYGNVDNPDKTVFAWGAQISARVEQGKFTLFGQGTCGNGVASYICDIKNRGYLVMPNEDDLNDSQLLMTWSAVGGISYKFLPNLFISGSYSHVRQYGTKGYYSANNYKYSMYVCGNIFWDITPMFRFGAEYLYGRRVNRSGETGSANRASLSMQFNF